MKKLYCFDFDGTLTKRDTMFMFLKFHNSKKFTLKFILYTPLFILLKLKLVSAEEVKKRFINSILGGESKETLEKSSHNFFNQNKDSILRKNALDFIQKIDRNQTTCFLVSASLDIWLKPFSDYLNMNLLCTEAEYKNEIFTGNFSTKNCNGIEKVNRIKEAIKNTKFDKTVAFGDTSGDKEMLSWVDESHFQFFH